MTFEIHRRGGGKIVQETKRSKQVSKGRQSDSHQLQEIMGLAPGSKNPRRGDAFLVTAFHYVTSLHTALNLLGNRIAELEWYLTPKGSGPKGERVQHEMLDILQNPNSEFCGFIWRKMCAQYLELCGEQFNVIFGGPKQPGNNPLELLPFPPMSVKYQPETENWRLQHNALRMDVSREAMMYLKTADLADPYGRGLGTGSAASDEVEISEYAAKYEKHEFANHAQPSFIVFIPGADQDTADNFKKRWQQLYSGPENVGKGAFFGAARGSEIQLEQITRSLGDFDLESIRNLSDGIIRRLWGISPEIVGEVTSSNQATSKVAERIFARNVVKPRGEHLRSGWSQTLLPMYDIEDELELWHEDPIPQNRTFMLSAMQAFPSDFTANEKRRLADHDEIEGGDVLSDPQAGAERAAVPRKKDSGCACCEPEEDTLAKSELPDNMVFLVDYRDEQTRQKQAAEAERISRLLVPSLIQAPMEEAFAAQLRSFALGTLESLPGTPPEAFQLLNPMISNEVERFTGDQIKAITETTQDQIKRMVNNGFAAGSNPKEVARIIRSEISERYLPEIIPNRATTIARTEMGRAANSATQMAYEASGVVDRREWIATPDNDTRDEHDELDGQKVALDEPFTVAGESAMYPGDFGEGHLDINCRCTVAAVIGGKTFLRGLTRKDYWKTTDEERSEAEDAFAEVTQKALTDAIKNVILPAINSISEAA